MQMKFGIPFLAVLSLVVRGREGCAVGMRGRMRLWSRGEMVDAVCGTGHNTRSRKALGGSVSLKGICLTGELAARPPVLPGSWAAMLASMAYPRTESSPKSLK